MGAKKIILLYALVIFGLVPAFAQTDSLEVDSNQLDEPDWIPSKPEKDVVYGVKFGVKMGVQSSILVGSEMLNPRPTYGLIGGGYSRYNLPKGISFQIEGLISFKGSSFKNLDTNYTRIRLMYIDVPLLVFKSFDKKHISRFGIGAQYSTLINSAIYLGKVNYPSGSPNLNSTDWSAVIAYQRHFNYFALQFSGKFGVTNINTGKPWPGDPQPKPYNSNGSIHNFSLECTILF